MTGCSPFQGTIAGTRARGTAEGSAESCGEQAGGRNPRQRARLIQPVTGSFQRLVGLQQLLFVGVEFGVAEDFPPFTFRN